MRNTSTGSVSPTCGFVVDRERSPDRILHSDRSNVRSGDFAGCPARHRSTCSAAGIMTSRNAVRIALVTPSISRRIERRGGTRRLNPAFSRSGSTPGAVPAVPPRTRHSHQQEPQPPLTVTEIEVQQKQGSRCWLHPLRDTSRLRHWLLPLADGNRARRANSSITARTFSR